jgi:N-glycosylase/DNA lyase
MNELNDVYKAIKPAVEARLLEFQRLGAEGSDREVFTEMCFCLCTPQNDARKAWGAVRALSGSFLETGGEDEIAGVLRAEGVRFHRNKAAYIVKNRALFSPKTKERLAAALGNRTGIEARNHLAAVVAGWGLKEASHFLRNIGLGGGLCILDRHIMRQLAVYGVAEEALTNKTYLGIEQRMIEFAAMHAIPVDAFDLVLWYEEKGEIFK